MISRGFFNRIAEEKTAITSNAFERRPLALNSFIHIKSKHDRPKEELLAIARKSRFLSCPSLGTVTLNQASRQVRFFSSR